MDIVVIVKRIDSSAGSATGKMMDIGDKTALDMAVSLRDRYGHGNSTVSALCIAPVEASDIIRECYSLGADTGYLLSDPAFESIDLNGLIDLLYSAIKAIGKCDMVVMASPSDDTVLVEIGKKLAGMLGFKHFSGVDSYDGVSNTKVSLRGKGAQREVIEPPAVINLACDLEQKIYNAMRIMKAYKKEINVLTAKDIKLKPGSAVVMHQESPSVSISEPEKVTHNVPHHGRRKTVKQ